MKKVLKPGFGDVRLFGGGKRRRKVLANEDESALPEWAMRLKCGPVYICVPDKQNDSCPKSVKTCPKGQKRVLKYGSSFPIRIQGKTFKPRRLGRRGRRKLLTEDEESVSALPPSAMRRRCGKVYV
jgi:hypothetical protein